MVEEQIFEIDTDLLQPNPLQPRGLITPESIQELADSIREHGVLEPLVVAKTPAGYQIIAGERRWRAAKLVGLQKVPVIIKETTPQGMLEMAIVENVQRVDLNPLERAQAYRRLMDEFSLSNAEIALRVAKSPAYISNSLRLLVMPDALKDALATGQTSEGHVRALAALEEPNLIIEAYKIVLQKNLSVRGAEELARKLKARSNIEPRTKPSVARRHSDELEQIQETISSVLTDKSGCNVKAKISQSRVEARMTLVVKGPQEQTTDVIRKLNVAVNSI